MKRVNFHLSGEQIEFLKRLKKETGIPASESIRRLLDDKMRKHPREEGTNR